MTSPAGPLTSKIVHRRKGFLGEVRKCCRQFLRALRCNLGNFGRLFAIRFGVYELFMAREV